MTTEAPSVELWDLDRIQPYPLNAKKHPEDQIEKLAKSIAKFNWTQPIVIDRNGIIIIGHGRRLAAIKLGLKKVPVVVRHDLSDAEANALRLADNRVTSTDYDMSKLQASLEEIDTAVDMSDFYDAKEMETFSSDVANLDLSAMVENIGDAVEDQKTENKKKAEEVDATAAPVVDAFGFKRVTVEQSRIVRGFMAQIESESGLAGAEALIHHIRESGYAG